MTSREFRDRLRRRGRRAGITIADELCAKLEVYYRLLETWNRKINLTGMDLADMPPAAVDRLLIEPLAAVRYCPGSVRFILDIGSGGGSPAIPFVLAVPGASMRLVESKVRKSVFLREVIRALELSRATVETARFEALLSRPDLHEMHDLLTIRAVRIETRMLMSLQAFVRPGGRLFLFQSASAPYPAERVTPPLLSAEALPLLESLGSRLVSIEKGGS